jgi:hypothetical protein
MLPLLNSFHGGAAIQLRDRRWTGGQPFGEAESPPVAANTRLRASRDTPVNCGLDAQEATSQADRLKNPDGAFPRPAKHLSAAARRAHIVA